MYKLKESNIWIIYDKKPNADGEINKKPFAAKGGATGSNEVFRKTWVNYNEAVAAASKKDGYGVGFVIPEGYFFLDIDKQGMESKLVQAMLRVFSNTYSEYSISGNGIHIYGKCKVDDLPIVFDEKKQAYCLSPDYYSKNSKLGMELYIGDLTSRYAVFTGNSINDMPLEDCTEGVNKVLNTLMNKEFINKLNSKVEEVSTKKQPSTKTTTKKKSAKKKNLMDYEADAKKIIDELSRQANGDKFCKLFYQGNFEGYPSQSEADEALCAIIAFKTDDIELIDCIFRQSGLYREKWDRTDYGSSTIKKAVEQSRNKKKVRPKYIWTDENGKESLSITALAEYFRENMNYILVKNDAFQSTRVYIYEKGCYVPYDDEMIRGLIKNEVERYNSSFARMNAIKEVVQNIKSEVSCVRIEELDSDESIINFENGILRITATDMVLEEHSPEIYSTVQIPCKWYGDELPTPVFDEYMKTLTKGDKEVEQLLLQFMGVCISNIKGWRTKKSLFMVGPGNTGKSQLKSLVERLLGPRNFIGIELKEIEARFGTSNLYGKRLAGSSDMSFLSIDELKTYKKLTGGDSVFAEYKGQQGFQFTYNGLLWFAMNKLVRFGGDGGDWVYDRILLVNCDNVIPLEKQDKQLLDKMYAERTGIIYKLVKSLQTVIENGYKFSEPESMKGLRKEYQKSNSTVMSFFEECMCELGPNDSIDRRYSTGKIYDIYKKWCKDNNNGFQKSAKEFRDDIASHLGKKYSEITTRVNGNTYYQGYGLTTETKNHYGDTFSW